MEGSAEDIGAPDSWESADLEESMRRLMVSSKKSLDSFPGPSCQSQDFAEEVPIAYPVSMAASLSATSTAGERCVLSEDALNQVDLFLREALEKPRERLSILRMEQDIIKFICDPSQQQLEFQDLPTSYLRLAAHRVSQHYYLQSVAMPDTILPDGSGSRIAIRKTSYCRLPPVRLSDIPVSLQQEDTRNTLKVAIKQRPHKSSHAGNSLNKLSSDSNSLKSVEERKEEYNKARARIFSHSDDTGSSTRAEFEPSLPDMLHNCSFVPSRSVDALIPDGCQATLKKSMSNSYVGSNRLSWNRQDKDPVVGRQRASTVAIFRDRELDRKDPDYDRSYDRYMQRFDPGFGFSGVPYTMQPLYAPAVNYNTEFPQLAPSHRPQISIEHQPRPIPQQLRSPWPSASTSSAVSYGPPEGLMAQYNPNHLGAHPSSSIYLASSQFPVTPRPMPFLHGHEHVQYPQSHQHQSETSFGLARPR